MKTENCSHVKSADSLNCKLRPYGHPLTKLDSKMKDDNWLKSVREKLQRESTKWDREWKEADKKWGKEWKQNSGEWDKKWDKERKQKSEQLKKERELESEEREKNWKLKVEKFNTEFNEQVKLQRMGAVARTDRLIKETEFYINVAFIIFGGVVLLIICVSVYNIYFRKKRRRHGIIQTGSNAAPYSYDEEMTEEPEPITRVVYSSIAPTIAPSLQTSISTTGPSRPLPTTAPPSYQEAILEISPFSDQLKMK